MRFILLELDRTAKIPREAEVKSTSNPRGFVRKRFTINKIVIIAKVRCL